MDENSNSPEILQLIKRLQNLCLKGSIIVIMVFPPYEHYVFLFLSKSQLWLKTAVLELSKTAGSAG